MLRAVLLCGAALALVACGGQTPQKPALSETARTVTYDRAAENTGHITEWIDAALADGKRITFASPIDQAAADFVELALHMGRIDGDYVDAYHGPKAWKVASETLAPDAEILAAEIEALNGRMAAISVSAGGSEAVRLGQLLKFTRAMALRLKVLQGEAVSFNAEVAEIYDEQIPVYDLSVYDDVLARIDALLPGNGPLYERVDGFRNTLAIPKDKLRPVFDRAIAECRARTQVYFDLPAGETFRMEFVTDKAWSGYNYYQGDYESLIQINTDFPIIIDRAVDLGCHEGYPGHHVWNLFIERELVGKRGWIEYSVNPLFGPFGPIAEGSANYGIKLAFPGDEKIAFEREVLFPMAGLDPALAQKLDDLNALTGQLSHATNEIARQYLDGQLTAEEAVPLIQKYYLASTEKSAQRLRFIDKYRAYVINYNIGRDRAEAWVGAVREGEAARWTAFEEMLTRPMTPSDIVAALDEAP